MFGNVAACLYVVTTLVLACTWDEKVTHWWAREGRQQRVSVNRSLKEAELGEGDNGAPDSCGGFEEADFPLKTTASF